MHGTMNVKLNKFWAYNIAVIFTINLLFRYFVFNLYYGKQHTLMFDITIVCNKQHTLMFDITIVCNKQHTLMFDITIVCNKQRRSCHGTARRKVVF